MDEVSPDFRILGPFEIRVQGLAGDLPGQQVCWLLAALLLSVGKPVLEEQLIRYVWGPSGGSLPALRTTVSRLRAWFRRELDIADAIEHAGPRSYLLRLSAEHVDAERFLAVRTEPDDLDRLAGALTQWRGDVLADAPDWVRTHPQVRRLRRERVACACRFADLALKQGVPDTALGHLETLTEAAPYEEPLHARLITLLGAVGRRADGLRRFERTRRRLAEELGIDPSPELREAHARLLRESPGRVPPAVPAPVAPVSTPAQLPADLPTFIGRDFELSSLLAPFQQEAHDTDPGKPTIGVIDGMAGIGKTALAVHAAHQLSPLFPDGQLFIDLHGFTHDIAPVDPAEALTQLLRPLGLDEEQIPEGVEQRAALLRSRLAGRRMLIVLDNAATEAQVRPLLPGTSGCLVLITSRRQLIGLENAHPIALDLLPLPQAVELFTAVTAGHPRADARSDLMEEAVRLCGRLPLAIQIAAARLRARPAWTVTYLLELLSDERRRLPELHAGQRSVATALQVSYQHLTAEQRRLFRLLGLHPGDDIDQHAAAALAGLTTDRSRHLLEDLLDANLLQQRVPGRYRFHDLVRRHAADIAARDESEPARRQAVDGLLKHYLRTASTAVRVLAPEDKHHHPQLDPEPAEFRGEAQALSWLDAERANMLALAQHCADQDWAVQTGRFSAVLGHYLQIRGHNADALALHSLALRTTRRHGDLPGESHSLRELGSLFWRLGRYAEALDHFRQALELFRQTGDQAGEAHVLNNLSSLYWRQARHDQALDHCRRALEIFRRTGDRTGEAHALNNLGLICRSSGDYAESLTHFEQGLDIFRRSRNQSGEGYMLNEIGIVHRMSHRYETALDCHGRVLAIARNTGDRNLEFEALHALGETFHAGDQADDALTHHQEALALAGKLNQPDDQARAHDAIAAIHQRLDRPDRARRHWESALDLYTRLDLPDADRIRILLAGLDGGGLRQER
ncbi:tetratricopeptide repeat protein [Nonomuraea sp. NPDC005650]|uniref:AfsR/SARP family transcriptional regulator n=1 Tax=Nonomuraea sp. NPDC005650 TaxID=3157045 RepID=UPI0033A035A4